MRADEGYLSNWGGGGGNGSRVVTNSISPPNLQYARLFKFYRNDPPFFHSNTDPVEAEEWLNKLEKIFRVMKCDDSQKVDFATYMLESDVEHWWDNT